ncbi:MAG: FAD binding domain-containing protein [Chloroflexota bacterium]
MLHIAQTISEATTLTGNLRAGGTDYMDRLRHNLVDGDIVDLLGLEGLDQIQSGTNGTQIGALTTIQAVAQSADIQNSYAGLAQAAAGLATPQIRRVGTIGGNLTQATRCQYYRHHHLECTKKGDAVCGARDGYHANGIIFDNGGCAHPHPSTLGMALMAYDAHVEINGSEKRSIFDVYGDGADKQHDHLLADDEVITTILLPAPVTEKATYFRATARARAEWATVECVVRLVMDGDTIQAAYVAVGAVGPVPLRFSKVEAALAGKPPSEETFTTAASLAAEGTKPLRDTGYKVPLMISSIEEALLQLI